MHPTYTYIKQSLAGIYSDSEASALAKWILTDVFCLSTIDLYAGKDMNFSTKECAKLEDILSRLKRYEPLQYILGKTTFCGLSFEVAPGVLIPRPETEELVDWIVSDYADESEVRILDVGTGSGCIPVALAKRLTNSRVTSWDVSSEALAIAERNKRLNGAEITLAQVDILSTTLPEIYTDILVSNPPYITEKERSDMERNVLDWEPELALFVPDNDPLLFYRRIAEVRCNILSSKGVLYYEINRAYGRETVELLQQMGYKSVELRKDQYGNDRMIKASRP